MAKNRKDPNVHAARGAGSAHLPAPTPWRRTLPAAALVLATVIVYLPAMRGQFVMDDLVNIQNNRLLSDFAGFLNLWVPGRTQQYYPITSSTHWLENQLWGLNPTGYHAVNVLLHALNALLVARLMRRLGVPAPWLIAAVFALHPIQVESVAYITERKNVLSAMFYLLAALAYLRFENRHFPLEGGVGGEGATNSSGGTINVGRTLTLCFASLRSASQSRPALSSPQRIDDLRESGQAWSWYALAMGLFAMALLSKTVAMSLPIALALAHVLRFRSLPLRSILPLIPMLLLGGALALVTARVEHTAVGAVGPEFQFTLAQRFIIVCHALLFYPCKLLWPSTLMFVYPRWTIDAGAIVSYWPVAIVIAISILAIAACIRGWRRPVLALAFYAVTIFPALGFVSYYSMRYSFVADHHQYLAGIGVIALIAGAAARFVPRRRLTGLLAAAALTALGVATWAQSSIYRDGLTLWTWTVQLNPDSFVARHNLAVELSGLAVQDIARGDFEQAAQHLGLVEEQLREALKRHPEYHEGHAALGDLLLRKQHVEEALEQYRLGLDAVRRTEDDLRVRSSAIRDNPPSAQYLLRMAHALEALGRDAEAEQALREAIAIAPGRVEGHHALAAHLARRGMAAEAAAQIAEVLKIDHDHVDTLILLGDITRQAGDDATAARRYRAALQAPGAAPARTAAMVKLAYLLATSSDDTVRNGLEAMSLAEKVIAASGRGDAPSLQALGAAQAEMGLFLEAIDTAGQARRLAEQSGQGELSDALKAQIASYRANKPWRE